MRTSGVFVRQDDVQCVIAALREMEIPSEDISLVVHDPSESGVVQPETQVHSHAADDVKRGGLAGALAGAAFGLSLLALPGAGALLAAGPVAQLLGAAATAGSGAAVGGMIGAFLGLLRRWGIPEDQARAYKEAIERGDAVISVSHGPESDVAGIFRRCGAREVFAGGSAEGAPSGEPRGPRSRP